MKSEGENHKGRPQVTEEMQCGTSHEIKRKTVNNKEWIKLCQLVWMLLIIKERLVCMQ